MDYINAKEVVALTSDLVKIDSENPSIYEKEISEFISQKLKEIGLKVSVHEFVPGRASVVGELPGKKEFPTLMFNGHTDTVPIGDRSSWTVDPLGGRVVHEKIYGRGAADMKGGIAAMISACRTLVNSGVKLSGNLMLTFVGDEEVKGMGIQDLLHRGYKADYAVVGEPTSLQVQPAHRGVVNIKIVSRGKACHASTPHKGHNAIYDMSKVCLGLKDLSLIYEEKKHPLLGVPTINVGTIHGGIKSNIVPDYCEIMVDRRLIPGEKIEEVVWEIERAISGKAIQGGNIKVEVDQVSEPSETPLDERVVVEARKAVSNVTGKDNGISGFVASSDMRFLVNYGKIPTVILGPGSLDQAHIIDEYIDIDQVVNATKIYALLSVNMLK